MCQGQSYGHNHVHIHGNSHCVGNEIGVDVGAGVDTGSGVYFSVDVGAAICVDVCVERSIWKGFLKCMHCMGDFFFGVSECVSISVCVCVFLVLAFVLRCGIDKTSKTKCVR